MPQGTFLARSLSCLGGLPVLVRTKVQSACVKVVGLHKSWGQANQPSQTLSAEAGRLPRQTSKSLRVASPGGGLCPLASSIYSIYRRYTNMLALSASACAALHDYLAFQITQAAVSSYN